VSKDLHRSHVAAGVSILQVANVFKYCETRDFE